MGFLSSKPPPPPPPPDFGAAAKEQGAANLETARVQGRLNNPNIVSPLGGQTVTFGANDQPTVTQTLTPQAQATLESQQRTEQALANLGEQGIGTAQNVLGAAFDPNLDGLETTIGGAGQISKDPNLESYGSASGLLDTSNVAAMPVNAGTTGQQAIMNRLAPDLERADKATQQRLANQGLVPGGEAFENAMISQNQQKNDLLSQAALHGIALDTAANAQGFGQAVQSRQFGNQAIGQNQQAALAQQQAENAAQNQQYNQLLENARFGNTAQQQSLQQQLALRNQPLNEITGLMSGSQIQLPQFQGYQGSTVAGTPILQGAIAQAQADTDVFGIRSANTNAKNAATAGLLGSAVTAGATFF